MQGDLRFSTIVCVTFQMLGEITMVDVLFSEAPRPCVATVKSFSFVENTISSEALRPTLMCVWEGGSLCSEQGQPPFPAPSAFLMWKRLAHHRSLR